MIIRFVSSQAGRGDDGSAYERVVCHIGHMLDHFQPSRLPSVQKVTVRLSLHRMVSWLGPSTRNIWNSVVPDATEECELQPAAIPLPVVFRGQQSVIRFAVDESHHPVPIGLGVLH
jgi:hypothetical protein